MSTIKDKPKFYYIRQDDVWKNINELISKHIGASNVYLDLPNRHTVLDVTITNPTPDEKGDIGKYGYIHLYITIVDDNNLRRLEVEGTWRYDCTQPINLFEPNDSLVIHHLLPIKAIQQIEGAKK